MGVLAQGLIVSGNGVSERKSKAELSAFRERADSLAELLLAAFIYLTYPGNFSFYGCRTK